MLFSQIDVFPWIARRAVRSCANSRNLNNVSNLGRDPGGHKCPHTLIPRVRDDFFL
jgi:hypothetical protein